MKILPVINNQNLINKNTPVRYERFDVGQDSFIKTSKANNPSFGHSSQELAREVLKNQGLRDSLADFAGKAAQAAFLAVLGIAAGNKIKEGKEDVSSEELDIFSQLFKFSPQKDNNAQEIENLKKQISMLQDDNRRLGDENARLEEELAYYQEGTAHIDIEDDITDDEIRVIDGEGVSESTLADEDENLETEVFQEDEPREDALKLFVFPRRNGAYTTEIKGLMSVLEELYLPESECDKLCAICSKLVKNAKEPEVRTIALALTENFKSETDTKSSIIEKYYNELGLVKEEPETLPVKERGDACGVNSQAGTESKEAVSQAYKYIKPVEGPKILDKMELPKETRKTPRFRKTSDSAGDIAGADSAVQTETKSETDESDDSLEVLTSRPLMSFKYKAVGTINENPFAEPKLIGYSHRNEPLYKWNKAGDLAQILSMFKYRIIEDRMEIKKWANEIYQSKWESKSKEQATDTEEIPDENDSKFVKIKWMADYRVAKNVTFEEIAAELTKNDYKNINNIIKKELKSGIEMKDSPIIAKIIETINGDSRFENFTIHAALRFIERLVDLKSPDTIKEECSEKLDVLFEEIKRTVKEGTVVTTHAGVEKSLNKFGQVVVVCNPNIIIKQQDNDEYRKAFGSFSIRLSISEYQTPKKYNSEIIKPIIKTICVCK